MTDNIVMNKTEYCQYAQALLKHHNVGVESDGKETVFFPENSAPELLAHSIFSNDQSKLIINRYSKAVGAIEFTIDRSSTQNCKTVSVSRYSLNADHLLPKNLITVQRSAS